MQDMGPCGGSRVENCGPQRGQLRCKLWASAGAAALRVLGLCGGRRVASCGRLREQLRCAARASAGAAAPRAACPSGGAHALQAVSLCGGRRATRCGPLRAARALRCGCGKLHTPGGQIAPCHSRNEQNSRLRVALSFGRPRGRNAAGQWMGSRHAPEAR